MMMILIGMLILFLINMIVIIYFRETKKQNDDHEDEVRKRGRSPSEGQDDSDFKKSRGFDERAWQRESDQQHYQGRGRGRGGR